MSLLFVSLLVGRGSRRRVSVAARLVLAGALVAPLVNCTSTQRTGNSPAYLIIDAMSAAAGVTPDKQFSSLPSDVLTLVKQQINGKEVLVPTIFQDPGHVNFRLALKDPGTVDSALSPSSNNFITVNRYHVKFIRADGHNVQGVDVPYEFDGGMSFTVSDSGSVGFMLVRNQAKTEAPLAALATNGAIISTIAEVTFFGRDQTGRDVSVKGRIDINFANWGD